MSLRQKATDEPCLHEPGVGGLDIGRHILLDRPSFGRIDPSSVGVSNEHVDDTIDIADAFDVLIQRQRQRTTHDFHTGPTLSSDRTAAALAGSADQVDIRTGAPWKPCATSTDLSI
ncbi:hypothetical protein ACFYXQ_27925 [Nocardia jiangxiensis]|uniref:Uncharacterized protein n=1 Tax=Nocardia jiangxiensis TaxID=282685 RepID=A0ABW6S5T0_9NOCA